MPAATQRKGGSVSANMYSRELNKWLFVRMGLDLYYSDCTHHGLYGKALDELYTVKKLPKIPMLATVARIKRRGGPTCFGSAPPLSTSAFGAFRHGFF
jgi:hypothetical protein